MQNKKILITGGTGLIGSQLIPVLLEAGNAITILSRHPTAAQIQFEQKVNSIDQLAKLAASETFDIVINLAGQGIADKRWTPASKQQIRDSRLQTTQDLITYLNTADDKPELFISGSAIGYYGPQQDEAVEESFIAGSSEYFSQRLCIDWEREAAAAEALGIRCCYLRTGIVLAKNGGALAKMLPPFKLGLGGPIGSGDQWMSWIHIADLIGIISHLIKDQSICGPVNATAPEPVTNNVFSGTLGKVLKRPAVVPMPAFIIKLLLGEMAEELLLSGQRVLPAKILRHGYAFKYSRLEDALRTLLSR